jgi:hypothetical protein
MLVFLPVWTPACLIGQKYPVGFGGDLPHSGIFCQK